MLSENEEELTGFGEEEIPSRKNLLVDSGLQREVCEEGEEEIPSRKNLLVDSGLQGEVCEKGDGETPLKGKKKKKFKLTKKRDKLLSAAKDWGAAKFTSLR